MSISNSRGKQQFLGVCFYCPNTKAPYLFTLFNVLFFQNILWMQALLRADNLSAFPSLGDFPRTNWILYEVTVAESKWTFPVQWNPEVPTSMRSVWFAGWLHHANSSAPLLMIANTVPCCSLLFELKTSSKRQRQEVCTRRRSTQLGLSARTTIYRL